MKTWWQIRRWILHPIINFEWHMKWRHRPKVGDIVEDCRGKTLAVASVDPADEDQLTLSDGSHASWMHCCSYPEE